MFWKKKVAVRVDEEAIDDILSRSVAQVLPGREALKKELMSGRRLRAYIGADATGPDLHIGHATNFLLLEKLRLLGHEVIVLFGDFTATIGDPSEKDATRKQLTDTEVDKNITHWRDQVGRVLSFSDKTNPAIVKKNSEWLSGLGFGEIVGIASNFTVQHMAERDMFERRMRAGKPVYLHEFLYPLMQGYDSVAMDVDIEVGGTDQTFNMLAGRTLQRKYHNKEKFVIATTLLENPKTGTKLMNKSESGYVALSDPPHEMFGRVMALPDEAIIQLFVDCTRVPLIEVEAFRKDLENGTNPRDIKLLLAERVVETYYSKIDAEKARESFIKAFRKGEMPDDAPSVVVSKGALLFDAVHDVVVSKGEWRRLVAEGAVSEVRGEKITDADAKVEHDMALRIGKKRFLNIVMR